MPLTATFRANSFQKNGRTASYVLDIVFSGTYPTGGDVLNLCAIPQLKTSSKRTLWACWVNNTKGYAMSYRKGTDLTNGKLPIHTAANTELANAAYPAAITSDTDIWVEVSLFAI